MKYLIKMEDWLKYKTITMEVEAKSVFDAIDIAAESIDNPESTELIEACPIIERSSNYEDA